MRLRTFGGLRLEISGAGDDVVTRPRSLALLAILAAAGSRGMTRDQVLGILWPESAPERARHALAQTVYNIRSDLGAAVVHGTNVLRLESRSIASDVDEFRSAVAAKRWADASALYSGPYLDGFYLADAPGFERWVEEQRARLAVDGARAIEHLAHELAESGQPRDAATQWLRLATMDPFDARFALRYMEACAAYGNRAGALAYARNYVRVIREELDAEADGAVLALMTRLRDVDASNADDERYPRTPTLEVVTDDPVSVNEPAAYDRPGHASTPASVAGQITIPTSRAALFTACAIGLAVLATSAWQRHGDPATTRPVLAVGYIRDLTSAAATAPGPHASLTDMLATSLGRLPALQVIASSRMLELMPRDADTSRPVIAAAARRAGATEIVEGELLPMADGELRLQVRRIDLGRGLVRGGYEFLGADRFALFDSVTSRVAADLGLDAPGGSLAEVSTRSPVAYRFYEAGLHAFYQFDMASARRLFESALQEDSSFAMATYYAWRVAIETTDSRQVELGRQAMRLATRASEHDRLLIRAHVGGSTNGASARIAGESLAVRYPRDPEGLMRAAQVVGDRSRARALLERSISLDSAAGVRPGGICRMCDAFSLLSAEYQWVDSLPAAERTLRRWIALRPEDAAPWSLIADVLVSEGRLKDAFAARRRSVAMGSAIGDTVVTNIAWALRSDDFDWIDRECSAALSTADANAFGNYRWYCVIGLRMQGRYADAMALVRDGRIPSTARAHRGAPTDFYNLALLPMESGHPREAADAFHRLATDVLRDTAADPGLRTRRVEWLLTLTATAATAAGDTARALRLADTIEAMGRSSTYQRDPLLHHFVRGIVLTRSRRDEEGIRELEASIFSTTHGYTRATYELGRALQRVGRPRDAIPFVRAALRGGIEGSALYVTRTEMHELLAELFDASGQVDSAAAHYAVVARAWRSADDSFRDRHDHAARRVSEIQRSH